MTNEQKLALFKEALATFETDEIRDFAADLFVQIPDDAIMLPSSSSQKYHNYTQCQLFGNLKHVLMVGSICNYLLGLEHYQEKFDKPKQRDCIRLAAYTHDAVKYGWNGAMYTLFTHPLISAEFVKKAEVKHPIKQGLRDYIGSLIESHSGQWNTSNRDNTVLPKPDTEDKQLIHICDYLSSRNNIDMTYSEELENTIQEIIIDMIDTEVMTFGKYKGETVKDTYENHPDYFEWLVENSKGGIREPMKTIIKRLNNK